MQAIMDSGGSCHPPGISDTSTSEQPIVICPNNANKVTHRIQQLVVRKLRTTLVYPSWSQKPEDSSWFFTDWAISKLLVTLHVKQMFSRFVFGFSCDAPTTASNQSKLKSPFTLKQICTSGAIKAPRWCAPTPWQGKASRCPIDICMIHMIICRHI